MSRRRLGQHFLSNPKILQRIIESAHLEPGDLVVEIGPGPGSMTRMIAAKVSKLIAIELDEYLYDRLSNDLAAYPNIELVHGDALEYPYEGLPEFKVVANIPYYITTPVIFRLLELPLKTASFQNIEKGENADDSEVSEARPLSGKNLKSMTLTIQKEVAERIVAAPGGKDYGVLSIMVQYYSEPTFEFIVPKEAFRPVPKVDSAVINCRVLEKPSVEVADEAFFFRIIRTAFSQRRKMLSNSLKGVRDDAKEWLSAAGIDPDRRPETLSIGDFARLANL
jgi:16S rRNA (adenine1518-N6/adenine1519-N6)-dimethyltransferase